MGEVSWVVLVDLKIVLMSDGLVRNTLSVWSGTSV